MCENPQVDIDGPAVAELVADVAAAVSRQIPVVSEDVYAVVLREIPELADDQSILALLSSSVHSNVGTCLQILQHQIELSAVHAPAASLEYARRRAQRGTPLTALLRAYRLGHTCFSDWLLNRSAARAARVRGLLSGERVNVSATEATLGYRLRQYHVGLVCWAGDATAAVDNITRLEHAVNHVATEVAGTGDPVFVPRDESSAWAWLPLGIRDRFDTTGAAAGADPDVHFAFGDAAKGATGFRLTHQQAIAAQAVALAAGSPPPRAVAFSEVAPVAMMLGSSDLLRAWVFKTLGGL